MVDHIYIILSLAFMIDRMKKERDAEMNPIIEASNLSKRYRNQNGRYAINQLELAIPKGQLYGLVGPDGAGKTTTLRILSTAMEQSAGSARVAGHDVRHEAEKARPLIGYMPQNFSLYPDMSVLENLNFFADLNQVSKEHKKERISKMLHFARLERFTRRRAAQLSGGMKKKLALACALIHDPQVLLLDEPSTGVDPVSRRELWLILAQVVQQDVTVLVSTPYMDEAERCHHVGILYQGRMLTNGSPAELESQLPFDILEVKARPRKTIRKVIDGEKNVIRWRPVGDRMRLSTTDIKRTRKKLKSSLKNENAHISILRPAKSTMEDVFIHLVEDQRKIND
jgi:ABC-2 type transport system ATP-binding protein